MHWFHVQCQVRLTLEARYIYFSNSYTSKKEAQGVKNNRNKNKKPTTRCSLHIRLLSINLSFPSDHVLYFVGLPSWSCLVSGKLPLKFTDTCYISGKIYCKHKHIHWLFVCYSSFLRDDAIIGGNCFEYTDYIRISDKIDVRKQTHLSGIYIFNYCLSLSCFVGGKQLWNGPLLHQFRKTNTPTQYLSTHLLKHTTNGK